MSNRTRNLHVWKTRLPCGGKREVRAQLFGSRWNLTSRGPDDEDWVTHTPPLLEHLVELEVIVEKKYRRNQVAWEHLVGLRKLIESRKPRG